MVGHLDTLGPMPTIVALGDAALLVRFGERLTEAANAAAISLADQLDHDNLPGVIEVSPGLVSVMLSYDPMLVDLPRLKGELRLRLANTTGSLPTKQGQWVIPITYDGPDLEEVSSALGMDRDTFSDAHVASELRVLATGFAPGFVYCGLHVSPLVIPRRTMVRSSVPAGAVLFAAGQSAVTATAVPSGWHWIGRTGFSNFEVDAQPPTRLRAGDIIRFVAT
jgi:KipI family sensor histidine kinase inhibitor